MTKEKENECSNGEMITGFAFKQIGSVFAGISVLMIIIFAFLKYYSILPITDMWFYALFLILGISIIMSIYGGISNTRCLPSMMKSAFKTIGEDL